MSSVPDDQTVKDHIARLRIKELSECLDRLGMKKQGRKEDLQRRLLTVIDDAGSLWSAGLQTHGMPQVEATKRVVEEVYARYMVEKATPTLRAAPSRTEATSAPTATANGGTCAASSRLPSSHSNLSGGPARWPASNAGTRPHHPSALGFLPVQPPTTSHVNPGGVGPSSGSSSAPHAQAGTSAGGVVRCICEQPAARLGELLSCCNCHVYQHARCVTKPETRASAPPHMCERCRAERIDPYWEVVTSDIMPAFKLMPTGRNTYVGTKLEPVQNAERTFTITPSQYELFKKRPNHKLQVVCMQLSDSVPYRCLWPLASELRVNGLQLHVYNRGAHTKPGKNQRDEPANIGVLANPSRNRITMSCSDPASYVLLLQIVRRRSTEEVKGLTKPPLPLPEAIERVKREIKSSDEDIEVDHAVVSLKCPLTGARVQTPARFSEIEGLMFFDLDAFLSVAERSRKWQCPNSMRNSSVYTLQVDAFMSSILGSLRDLPDVAEVQVSPQGKWRPVGGPGVKGSNSSWPWCDAGVAPSSLQLLAGQASSQPQLQTIKQDPEGSRPSKEDSSDEEDEDVELRKAAQAMQAQQRKAKQAASELIVISDSSEDEAPPPPPKRSRPAVPPSSSTAPAPAPPPRSIPPPGPIRVRVKPPASMLACPPPPSSAPPGQPPLPPNPPPPLPSHSPGCSTAPLGTHSNPHHRPSPPTPMELVHAAAVPPPPAPSSSGMIAHARAPALPAAQSLPSSAPSLPAKFGQPASLAGAAAAPHAPLPPTSLPGMPMMSMPLMTNGPSQIPYQGGWQGSMNGAISSTSTGTDCGGVGGASSTGVQPRMASMEQMQLAALEQMQQQLQQQLQQQTQQQQQTQAPLQQPNQSTVPLQMQLLQVQQQLHRMQQIVAQVQQQSQSQSQSQPLPYNSSPIAYQPHSLPTLYQPATGGLQLPLYPALHLSSQPHAAYPGLHNHNLGQPPPSQPALPSGSSSHHQPRPSHGTVPPGGTLTTTGALGGFRPASAHPSLHMPQPPSPPSPPALVQPPSSSSSPGARPAPQQQQQPASRRQTASAPQSEVIVIDDDSD